VGRGMFRESAASLGHHLLHRIFAGRRALYIASEGMRISLTLNSFNQTRKENG